MNSGDTIAGRYQLHETLGEGGFALVLRATDAKTGDDVAVKVLKDVDLQRETLIRFRREVEIVGSLRSPNTVRLLDHGETDDGQLYAVFEYVPGKDLTDFVVDEGGLPFDVVIHIMRQILGVLREAHRAGLLHRDIKPDNIRVHDASGDPWAVKLLDFGIARSTDDSHPSATKTGEAVGTPRYMSPEQLRGLPLTSASDIYSLGLVATELLTGARALSGSRISDQLGRLVYDRVVAVPNASPDAQALAQVLQRMTSVAPDRRLSTAESALAALDSIGGEPTRSKAEDARPSIMPAVAAGLAILVGMAATAAVLHDREQPLEPARPAGLAPASQTKHLNAAPTIRTPPDLGESPDLGVERVSGCGIDAAFRQWQGTGPERSWVTYIPRDYDKDRKYPVIIALRDAGERAEAMMKRGGLSALASQKGFIIIGPEDNALQPWTDMAASVDRISAVIDEVSETLCLDRERIYAIGHSRGGHLALNLLCADLLAGAATYAMTWAAGFEPCAPPHPKPVISFAPLRSGHSPLNGGKNCHGEERLPASAVTDHLRQTHQCSDEPRRTFKDGKSYCETWDCTTPFEQCFVDAGRNWPGTAQRHLVFDPYRCDGPVPVDYPAAERIWQFFENAEPNERE